MVDRIYFALPVHSTQERGHKSEIYHTSTGLSRNPFACKKFACCADAAAVVIFTIIIKCLFSILACAPHHTVHRVVYKHYKFYREVRGGVLVSFSCRVARTPDILLADGAVVLGDRHFRCPCGTVVHQDIVFSSLYFRAGNMSPTNSSRHLCETN